jgi:leader peptidase (prepilin peptidase)/N-methyltransferase
MTAFVVYHFGFTLEGLLALLFSWSLLALTGIDFNEQLLPDNITLPLLWLGLLVNLNNTFASLDSAVLGAVFGYLSLWWVFWLFKLLSGKEGMGHGDFKLLAALGAWLGWQQLLLIILLSSMVGAVVGILLIMFTGRDKQIPIPFGPYLAAAGWIAMMWGEELTNNYLSLFNY